MALDHEIDQLYQLPAGEFVAARNALAKRAGPGAAAIKNLQKPNAPAWAVNQLYWTRRKTFDRLIDAARNLRAAHSQLLSGKRADVSAAEASHRDAVKAAATEVRDILSQAGDPATAATMTAVSDTLQAMPGPERPGRFERPLKPRGFEALAGLVPGALAASKRLAEIVPIERGRRAGRASETEKETAAGGAKVAEAATRRAQAEAKRQAEAKKREAAKLEAQVRDARATERQAEATLAKTRDALARAERDSERLKKELDAIAGKTQELTDQIRRQEAAVRQASSERMRLEERRS
ncbi:MAG TPA: hypothetical protein VES67_17440 [Vicinamibacterales bacterium]|nr:hypothetical protein [Vicinamibacterales bacterium]